MLRKTRIILAAIFYIAITALFLDFTGTIHAWFGWMAKVQFLPALLALNVGVVVVLLLLTLLLGRIYCSVICPLGVMQDIFAWFGKKAKKNRYSYSGEKRWLRLGVLALFVVLMVAGLGVLANLVAPYSAYGRIAGNLLAPIWQWGNNGLAYLAERAESYAFYETEIWIKSGVTLGVAVATLLVVGVLAWRGGRTWCNTICPVGTVLGYVAKYSWLKPVIDTEKCNGCGLCARNCKAACINNKEHKIDYSRCVACMDCLGACKKGAISYAHPTKAKAAPATGGEEAVDTSRRTFLTTTAVVAATATLKAQEMKVDGGLAAIEDKMVPDRKAHLVPPGALSAKNLADHCTACQLCVAACPNGVLTPSTKLTRLMQPEMTYERGYCRPECTKCSEVCPTGAIRPITREDKSSTQIGHAVWVEKNCINTQGKDSCDNCMRHCPVGAIQMVPANGGGGGRRGGRRVPAVNVERCIGCGACEHLCPARPFSAIYVEGHERHKEV
ncbi:MAG: 4Fe-4S binding protein [Bacteroidaceae bacterium]|nr:4Fe-4S binding protein [Bacteroidaceae bacterium]